MQDGEYNEPNFEPVAQLTADKHESHGLPPDVWPQERRMSVAQMRDAIEAAPSGV